MAADDNDEARRRAEMVQRAEHRAIVQATVQAKRSGRLPAKRDSTGSEVVTAVVVLVAVIATLALAMKYG